MSLLWRLGERVRARLSRATRAPQRPHGLRAVALSLGACEGASEIPAYGLPDIPPADAAADASRRDAALPFPPGPDAEADAATKPDASDAGTDATDATADGGTD